MCVCLAGLFFYGRKKSRVDITNFFNVTLALELQKALSEYIIIVGQEIWAKDGHVLALGIHERIDKVKISIDEMRALFIEQHLNENNLLPGVYRGAKVNAMPCLKERVSNKYPNNVIMNITEVNIV